MKLTYKAKVKSISYDEREKKGSFYYLLIVEFLEHTIKGKKYFAYLPCDSSLTILEGDIVLCDFYIYEVNDKKDFDIIVRNKLYFITNANFKRILGKLDKLKIEFNEPVWKTEIPFLNSLENKDILLYKLIFEFQNEFLEYYNIIDKNNHRFIYDNHNAYHSSSTCEKILSDFNNYEIPLTIIEQGLSEEYKSWFISNQKLLELGRAEINDLFKEKHYKKWDCLPEKVEYENSGVHLFEGEDIEYHEREVNRILEEAQKFINLSSINNRIISQFGKSSYLYNDLSRLHNRQNLPFDDITLRTVLEYFELIFKRPLIKNLKEYYRIKNNPNLLFESSLLEKLGLHHCSNCAGKEIVDILNRTKEKENREDDLPF